MEKENIKLYNEKKYFKEDSENAFKRSKDLELVFQLRVQDLNQVIQDRQQQIQSMQFKIDEHVEVQARAAQQVSQLPPVTTRQEGQEVRHEEARLEEVRQEEVRQEERVAGPIWRPPGHPPVQEDECVQNVECEGNCEHRS